MKKKVITLWMYSPHKMAEIKDGKHTLLFGNYWDFHSGCYGTKMLLKDGSVVDFKENWTEQICSPWTVAQMIAKHVNATVVVKNRKTPFKC